MDAQEHTVVALQVENEPGILGSDRDYSPAGEAALPAAVPAERIETVRRAGGGPGWDAWQEQGAPDSGSWDERFGLHGGEFCSAWSVATYIDTVAEQGRQEYEIPRYVNVWLGYPGWPSPGFYPSGGAVWRTST